MQQSSDAGLGVVGSPPPTQSPSSLLSFVSSNRHKYDEAKMTLDNLGISTRFVESDLTEVQSDSLSDIAQTKARDAFSKFETPVLVEDDGLFIDALGGFPGPYASYTLEKIGVRGILDLLQNHNDRRARFVSVIAYEGFRGTKTFEAVVPGAILDNSRGDGWGYDPIFTPVGSTRTFAEMTGPEKVEISHRTMALQKFARWYVS